MAISNRQAAARVAVSMRRVTEPDPDPDPDPDPEAAGLRDSHAGEDMTRRGLVGGQAGRQAGGKIGWLNLRLRQFATSQSGPQKERQAIRTRDDKKQRRLK